MKKGKIKILSAIFGVLLCSTLEAKEAEVYLYVMFHDDNTSGERFRTKVSDISECLEIIKNSKLPMPNRPGGDYEVMGAMWCGGEMERNHNGKWWVDEKNY